MPEPLVPNPNKRLYIFDKDTTVVGDWEDDRKAAEAAGCAFEWAHTFFGRVNPFADRWGEAMKHG